MTLPSPPTDEARYDGAGFDVMPEDAAERASFDKDVETLFGGNPFKAMATAIMLWGKTNGNGRGTFSNMCFIFANQLNKHAYLSKLTPTKAEPSRIAEIRERNKRYMDSYDGKIELHCGDSMLRWALEETDEALTAIEADRDRMREALELARPLVEKWCHTQGNSQPLFATYLGPIDAALKSSKPGEG